MTNPRHAFETDNGRYYHIPGINQPLVSVTNANSVALAKYGLPLWYANLATEAAWEALPAMTAALRRTPCGITPRMVANGHDGRPCDVCVPCVTRHIKEAAERERDSASFLGSRVHHLAEAHLLRKPVDQLEGDDEAGLYVAQYIQFLADFDIDPDRDVVATEATVCDERHGYAGTGDIWLRLPFDGFTFDGHTLSTKMARKPETRGTVLIDIKTSRKRARTQTYPENLLQLTGLRHASHLVLPDDTLVPNIKVRGTATLQLREKGYALIPMPSGTREFRHFQSVLDLARLVYDEWGGGYDYRPLNPDGKVTPKRARKTTDTTTTEE